MFREGESEEYNSEVDGEDLDIDTNVINFDILGIRDGEHHLHAPILSLVMQFEELPEDYEDMMTFKSRKQHHQRISDEQWRARVEEQAQKAEQAGTSVDEEDKEPRPLIDDQDITRDFLTSDQSFVFSDEMIIFDNRIIECTLAIIDQRVYILYKETKTASTPRST